MEEGEKSIIVMFSGGIDSTLLVALIAEVIRNQDKFDPKDITLDLVNVSFSPETSSDRITGIFSYFELKR
jgi:asparagine synthetase B (glutamine-hydrolysing)